VCSPACALRVRELASSIAEWGEMPIGHWFAAAAGVTGVGLETIEHIENQRLIRFAGDAPMSESSPKDPPKGMPE
jgi:hypothetical protein